MTATFGDYLDRHGFYYKMQEDNMERTSTMKAARYNDGKPHMDYILKLPKAVEALSRVFEFGAAKYEDDNWKKGGKPNSEYLRSCLRHLFANDDYDSDSGCLHLAHAIWNLMVLIELNWDKELIDNEKFEKQKQFWHDKKRKKDDPDTMQEL